METKEIIKLAEEYLRKSPSAVEKLSGAGSSRRYYRLSFSRRDDEDILSTLIATVGDDRRENQVFCNLAAIFGVRAEATSLFRIPRIYAHTADYGCYLQEDFGDVSMFDLIMSSGEVERRDMVRRALRGLHAIQTTPASEWEPASGCRPFSSRRVRWDLNYFKYAFLKPCDICFDEEALEDEFESLARNLCSYPRSAEGFMYRDFQSRNVMCPDETPCLIDFQGGMRGPLIYDAVSFLWQAKARFSPEFRVEMMEYYLSLLSESSGLSVEELRSFVDGFVLLRTLQVLGAYGFRGIIQKKAHFIESITPALSNLRDLLDRGTLAPYPELEKCCRAAVASSRFAPGDHATLRVEVWSFSFKKGYPENFTGNGGGFVFDCRAMHNPGRYEEYKHLTGGDRPVIDFLEERGEVQDFLANAGGLVFPAVETYVRRGFRDLQVAFGCTGGRHRSVYCANAMAREIKSRYPEVEVRIIHREQSIDKML